MLYIGPVIDSKRSQLYNEAADTHSIHSNKYCTAGGTVIDTRAKIAALPNGFTPTTDRDSTSRQ